MKLIYDRRHRSGRWVNVIAACSLVILAYARPAAAQESPPQQEGPTTIALQLGVWARGGDHRWPRAALSLDHALGSFVARIEGWAVSRPETLCSDGVDLPECDDRKLIRGISLGARLIDRKGEWHPFIGAGLGATKYYNTGSQVYVELGTRYDVAARWGAEVKLASDRLGESGSVGRGNSINVGVWYAVRI